MLFYNCSVFIKSTVAGHKCEINLSVIVIVIAEGKVRRPNSVFILRTFRREETDQHRMKQVMNVLQV